MVTYKGGPWNGQASEWPAVPTPGSNSVNREIDWDVGRWHGQYTLDQGDQTATWTDRSMFSIPRLPPPPPPFDSVGKAIIGLVPDFANPTNDTVDTPAIVPREQEVLTANVFLAQTTQDREWRRAVDAQQLSTAKNMQRIALATLAAAVLALVVTAIGVILAA